MKPIASIPATRSMVSSWNGRRRSLTQSARAWDKYKHGMNHFHYFFCPTVIPESCSKVWMGPTRKTLALLHWVPSGTSTILSISLQERQAHPCSILRTNLWERDLNGVNCHDCRPYRVQGAWVARGRRWCLNNDSTVRAGNERYWACKHNICCFPTFDLYIKVKHNSCNWSLHSMFRILKWSIKMKFHSRLHAAGLKLS